MHSSVFFADDRWQGLLLKKMEQIWDLIAKFYPYYGDTNQLFEFLEASQSRLEHHVDDLERPHDHVKINAKNMFVK